MANPQRGNFFNSGEFWKGAISILAIVGVLGLGYATNWNTWVGWLVVIVGVFVVVMAFQSRRDRGK